MMEWYLSRNINNTLTEGAETQEALLKLLSTCAICHSCLHFMDQQVIWPHLGSTGQFIHLQEVYYRKGLGYGNSINDLQQRLLKASLCMKPKVKIIKAKVKLTK